jgi:hypothetical protein
MTDAGRRKVSRRSLIKTGLGAAAAMGFGFKDVKEYLFTK